MKDKAFQLLLSAVLGTGFGWTATSLTLAGRVTAIEQSLIRIEARMDGRQPKE